MSIESELKKLTAAIEANTAAILKVSEVASAPAPATTTAETPKPSPAKAEPAPEPSPAEPSTEEATVDKKAITARVIKLAKTKGRDAAGSLLAKFGATKVPDIAESDYPKVWAELNKLLPETEDDE